MNVVKLTALGLACALPLIATTATARMPVDLECRFTVECYETESCEETDYTLRLTQPDMSMSTTIVSTDFGDTPGHTDRLSNGAIRVRAATDSASQLTIVTPDLGARHVTIIHEGPQLVTYHGTCSGGM